MKHLLAILLLAACSVTAQGQTIKSLGYNTTNSTVIGPTSGVLLFTNGANFPTVSASTVEVGSQLFVGDAATLVFDGEGPENWRSALGLGATWLTNTNVTNFRTAIGLGATNNVVFEGVIANAIYSGTNTTNDIVLDTQNLLIYAGTNQVAGWDTNFFEFKRPVQFNNTTNAAATRTNLSLGLPALTNTSNLTIMRELAGSTNTNEPFSGSISVVGTNNTNTLVFSNGILLSQ